MEQTVLLRVFLPHYTSIKQAHKGCNCCINCVKWQDQRNFPRSPLLSCLTITASFQHLLPFTIFQKLSDKYSWCKCLLTLAAPSALSYPHRFSQNLFFKPPAMCQTTTKHHSPKKTGQKALPHRRKARKGEGCVSTPHKAGVSNRRPLWVRFLGCLSLHLHLVLTHSLFALHKLWNCLCPVCHP